MTKELFKIKSTCKGGGYRYARTIPLHPKANKMGLYPLHRVLVENSLGRILSKDEVVHHIDENKDNNSLENLSVMKNSDHARLHRKMVPDIFIPCFLCLKRFGLKGGELRRRVKMSASGNLFCSISCAVKFRYLDNRG